MSSNVHKLGDVCVSTAAESTFSTSPVSSFSDCTRIPAEEAVLKIAQDPIAQPVQANTLGYKFKHAIGRKGGTLTFKTPLVGASANSGATPTAPGWLSKLLTTAGYTEAAVDGGATHATNASTTTSLVLIDGQGAGFEAGLVVGLLNASSKMEWRVVTAVSTDTLTISPALSFTPATSATVYGAVVYALDGPDTETRTFVVRAGGNGGGYAIEYTLTGCCAKPPKMTVAIGGRVMLEWEFNIDSWTATTTSGTLPAEPTIAPVIAVDGSFYWGTTSLAVTEVSLDPGVTLSEQPSPTGAQGRVGWLMTDATAKVAAKPYFTAALRTDYSAATARTVLSQLGATATGSAVVMLDTAQIVAFPGEGDANGNSVQELALEAKAPTVGSNLFIFAIG